MTPTTLLEKFQWRYATKQFDTERKIPADTWDAIEDSLVLTPSSFGIQPWKFIIVTDEETKKALLPHSWNQAQVVDCSHLVVLAAQSSVNEATVDSFVDTIHATRGGNKDDLAGYRDLMAGFISRMSDEQISAWAKNQVYIALGQLMASAAVLDIDACPMEGINPTEYDRLLGLEGSGFHTVVACPMGYRSADDKYASAPKVRYAKERIIEHK